MALRVRLGDEAADALRVLAPKTKRSIRDALSGLAEDVTGDETGLDVRELDTEGVPPRLFRLRVGDWRVAFQLVGKEIQIIRIFHRREGYEWIEDVEESRD